MKKNTALTARKVLIVDDDNSEHLCRDEPVGALPDADSLSRNGEKPRWNFLSREILTSTWS